MFYGKNTEYLTEVFVNILKFNLSKQSCTRPQIYSWSFQEKWIGTYLDVNQPSFFRTIEAMNGKGWNRFNI